MCTHPELVNMIQGAQAAEQAGDWDVALVRYETAAETAAANGDIATQAELLRWMGRVHSERGAIERAAELYESSLAKAQQIGHRRHAASALNALATTAQVRGQMLVAEEFYTRAARLAEESGNRKLLASVNQNLGTLAAIRGDARLALGRYQDAVDQLQEIGDLRLASHVLNNMGMLYTSIDDLGAAEISFHGAAQLAQQSGDPGMQARIEINRTELQLRRKNYDAARGHCDHAIKIYEQLRSESGLGEAHRLNGIIYRETGEPLRAESELRRALQLALSCDSPLLEAETERELARVYLQKHSTREALRALNRAYALFERLEAQQDLHSIQQRLEQLESTYYAALQLLELECSEMQQVDVSRRHLKVSELVCGLAKQLGYQAKDLTWLSIACHLYDVGRTAGPAEDHPAVTERIVRELGFPIQVALIVRSHHEHWDGSGYPDGLKGERIPLEARILRLADVYARLTSARNSSTISSEEALRVIESEVGRVYDPQLFQLLRKLVSEQRAA